MRFGDLFDRDQAIEAAAKAFAIKVHWLDDEERARDLGVAVVAALAALPVSADTPEGREQMARAEDPAKTFAQALRCIARPHADDSGESDRLIATNALELHPEFWEEEKC